MKKLHYFVILVMLFLSACSSSELDLGAEEFATALDDGKKYTLVDVRTSEEFNTIHLANAINIDINLPSFDSCASLIDSTNTVYVYCQKGSRSSKAAKKMSKLGFKVYNLDGGIDAWQNAGKPVVAAQ